LIFVSMAACEREPVQMREAAMPAPDAEQTAPPRTAGSAPIDVDARIDLTVPVRSEDMLPQPPSDEPARYAAWLGKLGRVPRAQVDAFCASQPRTYFFVCGGIGPLHIPRPPRDRLPMDGDASEPADSGSRFATRDAWYRSLNANQRTFVKITCDPDNGVNWEMGTSDLCGTYTPLVVAFEAQPVRFAGNRPTVATPWLALDRDGDGAIADGRELFGNRTVLAGGNRALHGFDALAELDANHDGRIDARDPAFASLVLWADRDGDRAGRGDELRPLADVVVAISLAYHVDARCDARGNCEGERAELTWRAADGALRTGAVVDVYLGE
jgi:hypothetical protein